MKKHLFFLAVLSVSISALCASSRGSERTGQVPVQPVVVQPGMTIGTLASLQYAARNPHDLRIVGQRLARSQPRRNNR